MTISTTKKMMGILKTLLLLIVLDFCADASSAQIITTIAGNGAGAFSGDGGPATAAALHFPSCITLDATGNLYITDMGNFRVRTISSSGTISTIAGNGTILATGDGIATALGLDYTRGIGVDGSGNVYFVERESHRARKVSPAGIKTVEAGIIFSGYSGDNGPATDAQMHYPDGLAVDGSGNVYIADEYNNAIR